MSSFKPVTQEEQALFAQRSPELQLVHLLYEKVEQLTTELFALAQHHTDCHSPNCSYLFDA